MKTAMTLKEQAAELAGNWRKFDSFAYFGRDDVPDPENWAILYTHNRDSRLLDQSNAAVIAKRLAKFPKTAVEISCNHWAVGHVDGWMIRCLNRKCEPTKAIAEWLAIQEQLENYPVLDEDHYSELENDATWENVREQVSYVSRNQGWEIGELGAAVGKVEQWLSENDPGELESRDDQGGYPSDEAIESAFEALGFVREE